jgi:NADH-quinone oxidoreductase subunit A
MDGPDRVIAAGPSRVRLVPDAVFLASPCENIHKRGAAHIDMHGWVPILIMIGLGAGFGALNIVLSHLVAPRKPTPEKLAPYECGMPAVGDARERHPVKFYMVAMIFLLFDIEVAFLYPFAMALRELGWFGFVQILVFFAILLGGYIYVWRKGVLDWGHERA